MSNIADFHNTLNLLGNLYHSGYGFYPENNNGKKYNTFDDTYYDLEECCKSLNLETDYSKIILKLDDEWTEFPEEWYNSDEYYNEVNKIKFRQLLPKLNTKNYIKILSKFTKIEIDASIKQSKITIDDILFASRGLCADHTRNIESFKVLKCKNNILTLALDIDNWST